MIVPFTYLRKPQTIEAIQYLKQTCEYIHGWMEQEHRGDDREFCEDGINLSFSVVVDIGDWIVKESSGEFTRYSNEEFKEVFTRGAKEWDE